MQWLVCYLIGGVLLTGNAVETTTQLTGNASNSKVTKLASHHDLATDLSDNHNETTELNFNTSGNGEWLLSNTSAGNLATTTKLLPLPSCTHNETLICDGDFCSTYENSTCALPVIGKEYCFNAYEVYSYKLEENYIFYPAN